MDRLDFVKTVIDGLSDDLFDEFRSKILGKYIPVYSASKEAFTRELLVEKVCDYFKKAEINTGKYFGKVFDQYISNLDYLVDDRIKTQRNNPTRAQRYYQKTERLKKERKENENWWMDFSRIIICLYAAVKSSKEGKIEDFDFSLDSINIERVMRDVRKDKVGAFKWAWLRTDLKERNAHYALDRSTFLILIMVLYYLKSNAVEGEF